MQKSVLSIKNDQTARIIFCKQPDKPLFEEHLPYSYCRGGVVPLPPENVHIFWISEGNNCCHNVILFQNYQEGR